MSKTLRKYVEILYTIPADVAAITVGRSRADRDPDNPVHLFQDESGITASVSLQGTTMNWTLALNDALDLAADELDEHMPDDIEDVPEPWSIRLVDHDGMEDNLLHSEFLTEPAEIPAEPVEPTKGEDGDEDGELAEVAQ